MALDGWQLARNHKTYIHCVYEILPFLWFSMKLGVINSFLIVCFTMVQKKYSNQKIFTKFIQKYHVMAIKQHLGKNALHLQSIQEKILPIIFSTISID